MRTPVLHFRTERCSAAAATAALAGAMARLYTGGQTDRLRYLQLPDRKGQFAIFSQGVAHCSAVLDEPSDADGALPICVPHCSILDTIREDELALQFQIHLGTVGAVVCHTGDERVYNADIHK